MLKRVGDPFQRIVKLSAALLNLSMTKINHCTYFTTMTNAPNEIKLINGDEIIRIIPEGFHYRGQLIEDAGEAHYLLVEFLRRAMPNTQWEDV